MRNGYLPVKTKLVVAYGFILATIMAVIPVLPVSAASITWDGGGGDDNFSTAANWAGDVAPQAGDDIIFDNSTADFTVDLPNNDLADGTSFNTITYQGGETEYLTVSGNAIELVGGLINSNTTGALYIDLSITLTAPQTITTAGSHTSLSAGNTLTIGANNLTLDATGSSGLTISSDITGSGSITKTGTGNASLSGNNASLTGIIVINAGYLSAWHRYALGSTVAPTTVSDGASLGIGTCAPDFTFAEDLNLTGGSYNADWPKLTAGILCAGGGGSDETYGRPYSEQTANLTGNIALGSDITFGGLAETTVISGAISGNYAISMYEGFSGVLNISSSDNQSSAENGIYSPEKEVVTLSDNLPNSTVNVFAGGQVIVTGTRGDVNVNRGTIGGTGTVGILTVTNEGILAPGLSPGCLNSSNLTLLSGATYQFEIEGATECTGYDQMRVTGTVSLTDSNLDIQRLSSYRPANGVVFVVIDNDGSDAVSGEFDGMPAGSTFTVDGVTYRISYSGGDGNDVTLTVIDSSVGEPDTGLPKTANVAFIALASTLIATAMMITSAYIVKRR
jgi:fibronectin-binding autotransporter adhesin